MYQGSWAVGASHSTATMSSGGSCGLYGLRLMHRPNISLSCFGPRAGQAIPFLLLRPPNPNPNALLSKALTPIIFHHRLLVNLQDMFSVWYGRGAVQLHLNEIHSHQSRVDGIKLEILKWCSNVAIVRGQMNARRKTFVFNYFTVACNRDITDVIRYSEEP